MKNILASSILSFLSCTFAYGQLGGDGYYRARNLYTNNYVSIVDNYGEINIATTKADLEAIKSFSFDIVCSDPGSIVYVERKGSITSNGKTCGSYNLSGQGTSTYSIIKYYLGIMPVGNTYQIFATANGQTAKLGDDFDKDEDLPVGQPTSQGKASNWSWNIYPVNSETDCYFGVKPTVKANGNYYATMYADFGFTPAASAKGMKVYYVDTIWEGKAVIREINGEVPANTPVIFLCPSESPSGNRLDIAKNNAKLESSNQLSGVYFRIATGDPNHKNFVGYDPNTMRILGVCKDGTPGFVKMEAGVWEPEYWYQIAIPDYNEGNPLPANSAYLKVPAGSPDELPLLDYADYPLAGISGVEADSNVSSDIRTLSGVTVRKNATTNEGLSSGIYIWNNKKVVVK